MIIKATYNKKFKIHQDNDPKHKSNLAKNALNNFGLN